MKALLFFLVFALALASGGFASEQVEAAPRPTKIAPALPATNRLPGVDLAEGITQLTGVAISPLLGVSTVGAWRYHQASAADRPFLPWFCQPYIWGAGFCLLGLCLLKDIFGTAAPPLLKKPLDWLELFENKLSALVACSAFLPFVVAEMERCGSPREALLTGAHLHYASPLAAGTFIDPRFVTIPFAAVCFLVVWLSCHAINVLVALCPFGVIDAALKLCKGALLSFLVTASFVNPYLGAGVALVILFGAALVAPWAFRLTVFGFVFALDVLLPARSHRHLRLAKPHAFLARKLDHAPVRTLGWLAREANGNLVFTYRPWLLLPARCLALPQGEISLAKGLLYPSLLHCGNDMKNASPLLIFLPRYRNCEQPLGAQFAITKIMDNPLVRGIRAVRTWLGEMIAGRAEVAATSNT